MITFLFSLALLLVGYFVYGRFVERTFGINRELKTPAYTLKDGVDYVPMSWGKIFLIQFLNIAGLGPIFGAIMGAVYGPVAFLWIVLGSILGGAMHDYFSGMLSLRNGGMSLSEIVGKYAGIRFKQFVALFTLMLLILVGVVFIAGPAKLLANFTPTSLGFQFWVVVIFIYYVLATMLPIDKIIGKIYPVFGFALLFMALGIGVSLIWNNAAIPEAIPSQLHNMRADSDKYPIFPMLFITIACGAISGFHATQSPLMARCMKNEREGRRIFYGAMIAEAVVALVWAAAAMSYFGSVGGLQTFLANNGNNAAVVVNEIAHNWLGQLGGLLAIIGVIAAPITSGDTAFRSARLIVADFIGYGQKAILNRLWISIPLFAVGFLLLKMNFEVIWRYFAWANQTLACITLWIITFYLLTEKKNYWISLLPAVFMTAVVTSYILIAPEGFAFSTSLAYPLTALFTALSIIFFAWKVRQLPR